jgi:hypothetical protein
MSSTRSSIKPAFVAAFSPESFLANFYDDVIRVYELQASSVTETSMTVFRKKLNGMLKIYRKKMTAAGEEERGKEVTKASRIALSGLFVLFVFEDARRSGSGLLLTVDQFLEKYPRFAGVEDRALPAFRNFMAVSLTLEEAKNNKAFHIEICARLSEGFAAKYITGSGQSAATSRRVSIYEREGNVTAEGSRKVKREQDANSESSNSKRSRSESISDDSSVSSELTCYLTEQEDEMSVLACAFAEQSPYTPEDPAMLEPTEDLLEYLSNSSGSSVASAAALDAADFDLETLDDLDDVAILSMINNNSEPM